MSVGRSVRERREADSPDAAIATRAVIPTSVNGGHPYAGDEAYAICAS
jgi:hypothetical protein